jgi:hypothetical protein
MHPDVSEVRNLNQLSEDINLLTEQPNTPDPEPEQPAIDLSKMNRHQRRTIQALTRRAQKKVRK